MANKKRKSTSDLSATQTDKRRRTLDAFFPPQVNVRASDKGNDSNGARELVSLNEEQVAVLHMIVEEGKNVFFTGAAGTGKSLLLQKVITALRNKYSNNPAVVSVTASTGMAASHIGGTTIGMTIHSWGAITPDMHQVDKLIPRIRTCKPALKRWTNTKVLIMDEVSMVDGYLFDTLAKLARELRGNRGKDRPFGGIQLVVTGDFFQLPPVTKSGAEPFFAFECQAWEKTIQHIAILREVFRQKDSHFVELLNELRKGHISPFAQQTFMSLSRPLPPLPSGVLPTELYALRSQVNRANATRLKALSGYAHVYRAYDTGREKKVLAQMVVPSQLELKIDAQVMLVKNIDDKLVNGSVGRVLGFQTKAICQASAHERAPIPNDLKPRSHSASEKPRSSAGSASSPPDKDPMKSSSAWKGSRAVRNVQVGPDGRTPVICSEKTVSGKENEERTLKSDEALYPLVEFHTHQGTEIILVVQDEFRIEDNEGQLLARRIQLPLVLAWAMSIHKSQGQTIQQLKVDLQSVFETGQSYVALSRAASLDGLQVIGFDSKKVKAHPKVIAWSERLVDAPVLP